MGGMLALAELQQLSSFAGHLNSTAAGPGVQDRSPGVFPTPFHAERGGPAAQAPSLQNCHPGVSPFDGTKPPDLLEWGYNEEDLKLWTRF